MKYKSTFFKSLTEIRISNIKKLAGEFQQSKMKNQIISEQDKEHYSIYELQQMDLLTEQAIPMIIESLSDKASFYVQLIAGFQRIEQVAKAIYHQSRNIRKLEQLLYNQMNLNPFQISSNLSKLNCIQLKLLGVFKSSILNNYTEARLIEMRLNEILSYQKTLNPEIILDISILNDQVLILQVSAIQTRGKILNTNKKAISKFFGYENKELESIDEVIPQFIQRYHSQYIQNYIDKGFSKFFWIAQHQFYVNFNGLLENTKLKLENLFENKNDYIISASLLKKKQDNDYILFDRKGRILGISEKIHSNIFTNIKISDILELIYMQSVMVNIAYIIGSEKEQLSSSDYLYSITDQRQSLTVATDLKGFAMAYLKFRDNNVYKQNRSSSKNLSHGKSVFSYSQSYLYSQQNQVHSEESDLKEDQKAIIINGHKITMLSEEDQILNRNFYRKINQSEEKMNFNTFDIHFTLTFQSIGKKKNRQSYFIMKVTDFKKIDEGKVSKTSNTGISYLLYHESQNKTTETDIGQHRAHADEDKQPYSINPSSLTVQASVFIHTSSEDELVLEVHDSIAQAASFPQQIEPYNEISKLIQQINPQQSLFPSKPVFINTARKLILQEGNYPIVEDDFTNIQKEQQNMLILQSPRNDEIQMIDQEDEQEIEFAKSNSIEKPKDHRIKEIIIQNKTQQEQEKQEVQQKRSSSSLTSNKTSFSIFQLIKSLQYTETLSPSLRMLLLINIFLEIIFLLICFLHVAFAISDYNVLTAQLNEMALPNDLNNLYNQFTDFSQMMAMKSFKLQNTSSYLESHMEEEIVSFVGSLSNEIFILTQDFAIFETKGYLQPFIIKIFTETGYIERTDDLIMFLAQFHENSYHPNSYAKNNELQTRELLSIYFFKLNLPSSIQLCRELVVTIRSSFYADEDQQNTVQLLFFILSIAFTAFLILIQIKIWKRHLLYQQKIILLVSKMYQSEAEKLIIKYKALEELFRNEQQKWKQLDFFQLIYSDNKKFAKFKNDKNKAKAAEDRSSHAKNSVLNFRINEANFSFLRIYAGLILLWLFLAIFFLGGFIFQIVDVQQTKPQIELGVEFMVFKQNYEALTLIAELIKSDYLVNDYIIANKLLPMNAYVSEESVVLQQYYSSLFEELIGLHERLMDQINLIYDHISQSSNIDSVRKEQLTQLYHQDMCSILYNEIPFCNQDAEIFQKYPGWSNADNYRAYIQYGIFEIVSRLDKLLNMYYEQELLGKRQSRDEIMDFVNNPDRIKLIVSYFLDLYLAFDRFEQIIFDSMDEQMAMNLVSFCLYFSLGGMCIFLISGALIYSSIQRAKVEMRLVRIALSNIPAESLNDQQTMSQIRNLQND